MAELTRQDVEQASDSGFERLGQALDDLEQSGHLHDDDLGTGNKRVRISRTYLWLLGYLKKDNGAEDPDRDYQKAVSAFYVDIGRTSAQSLDPDAWHTLVELAAFIERPPDTSRLQDPQLRPAVLRAIHLRLYSYGLVSKAPNRDPSNFDNTSKANRKLLKGLRDFAQATWLLRLSETPLNLNAGAMDLQTMALLFSHTRMIEALTVKGEGFKVFSAHPDFEIEAASARKLLNAFIGNLALVELWLLGYDVRPGTFRIDGPHARERSETLHKALNRFAIDRDMPQANKRSIAAGAWFFDEARRILNGDAETAPVEEADINAVLSDHKQMAALRKEYRSLGTRIIDGARRALAWIIGGIKRIVRTVVRLVRNVARAINAGAVAVYKHLRDMFRIVALGFDYVVSSPVGGSDPQGVYMQKGADFDFTVVVHPAASDAKLENFYDALDLRVRAMQLGGRIIGQLWRLIRQVISLTNAALGWLGMLMALLKLGNWLRRSATLAVESRRLVSEFAELTVADQMGASVQPA